MTSIYHKTCPACNAQNPADAAECRCGQRFLESGSDPADEQSLAESELLADYLKARIEQAVGSMQTAQAALADDPKNFDKAAQVLRAVQAVRELCTDLDAQHAHTAHIRELLDAARGSPDPAESERPGEAFQAAQAARAERLMARFEGTDTKQCPECQLTLPISSVLCLCGHSFSTGDDGLPRHARLTADRPRALTTRKPT